MTRQDCSTFSLVYWPVADFMRKVCYPRNARPSGKMHCCCQISIAENHIVFDAKPTRLNQKKKHAVTLFLCFLKQTKFEKSTENITSYIFGYRQRMHVEDIAYVIVNMHNW